jgi:hypothetical protein
MKNRSRRSLVVLAVVAAVSAFVSGCYNDPDHLRKFAEHHQTVQARVRHLDCANHGAVYYEFTIDGENQAGRAALGTIDCRSSKVGMPVLVYYYPGNPRIHSTMSPSTLYAQEKGYSLPAWAVFALAFPAFVVVVSIINLSQSAGAKRRK